MPNPKQEPKRSSFLLFFPLLFLMLILEIVHLPAVISPYRPDFLALLIIYFAIADSRRINVGTAWLCGLLLDFLAGAPIGANGLCIAFSVYILVFQFKHFKNFLLWQQMLIVGLVNFIGHVGVYWICHLIGQTSYTTNFGWESLVTMFTWPLMFFFYAFLWSVFNISSFTTKSEQEM